MKINLLFFGETVARANQFAIMEVREKKGNAMKTTTTPDLKKAAKEAVLAYMTSLLDKDGTLDEKASAKAYALSANLEDLIDTFVINHEQEPK